MNASRKRVKPPVQRERRQDPRRLRQRRIIARMTQAQLAAAAQCSVGYLCELEQGNYSATPGLLGRLADALGCDITEIMPAEVVAALDEFGPAGLAPGQRDYR